MTKQTGRENLPTTVGANLVALAGLGFIAYGLALFVRNFTGFIELGLSPDQVGVTPEQIRSFDPQLYNYISHLQVANAGLIIALGVAVMALAIFGIRRGEHWALWTALLAPVVALVIALPLHYPYGFATLGHLGPVYIDTAILIVGIILSYRQMKS